MTSISKSQAKGRRNVEHLSIAPILKLPSEIHLRILNFVYDPEAKYEESHVEEEKRRQMSCKDILAVCLVNKAFADYGQDILFRYILPVIWSNDVILELRATFQHKPYLVRRCQLFQVQSYHCSALDICRVIQIGFPRVQKMSMLFGHEMEAWSDQILAMGMPNLRVLRVEIHKSQMMDKLRKCVSAGFEHLDELHILYKDDEFHFWLPKEEYQSGRFTRLTIDYEWESTSWDVAKYVNWPKSLVYLDLAAISAESQNFGHCPFVREFILPQQPTLKELSLGDRYGFVMDGPIVQLSDFPVLESLTLRSWLFNCLPEDVCAAIFSAPGLKYFTWDLRYLNWEDFEPVSMGETLNWWETVIRLCCTSGYALRRVMVFMPEPSDNADSQDKQQRAEKDGFVLAFAETCRKLGVEVILGNPLLE